MKRQRGRGGRKPGGGGGHQPNRSFESNGPDVKIRGPAAHVYEKYLQLSRDASSAGDRVMAENYLQHAEHYYRILRAMQPHHIPQPQFEQRFEQVHDFEAETDLADEGDLDGVEADGDGESQSQIQSQGQGHDQLRDRRERRPDGGFRRDRDRERGDERERGPERERSPDRERGPERDRGPRLEADRRGEDHNEGEPGEGYQAESEEGYGGRRRRRRGRFRPDGERLGDGEPGAPRGEETVEGFGDAAPSFLVGGD